MLEAGDVPLSPDFTREKDFEESAFVIRPDADASNNGNCEEFFGEKPVMFVPESSSPRSSKPSRKSPRKRPLNSETSEEKGDCMKESETLSVMAVASSQEGWIHIAFCFLCGFSNSLI